VATLGAGDEIPSWGSLCLDPLIPGHPGAFLLLMSFVTGHIQSTYLRAVVLPRLIRKKRAERWPIPFTIKE
jgi:hypothetical protein